MNSPAPRPDAKTLTRFLIEEQRRINGGAAGGGGTSFTTVVNDVRLACKRIATLEAVGYVNAVRGPEGLAPPEESLVTHTRFTFALSGPLQARTSPPAPRQLSLTLNEKPLLRRALSNGSDGTRTRGLPPVEFSSGYAVPGELRRVPYGP